LLKAELERSPQTDAITVAALPDETSLQFISKFVSQFPQNFVYHYLKGNALWEKKSYSDAVICYEVSLSLDPSNASVMRDQLSHSMQHCDNCLAIIHGIRYRCKNCREYNSCSVCYHDREPKLGYHLHEGRHREHWNINHEVLPIPRPEWEHVAGTLGVTNYVDTIMKIGSTYRSQGKYIDAIANLNGH